MNIDRETADKYQGLFNYLNDQYGINPTIEGMNDLIAEVDKTKQLLIPLVINWVAVEDELPSNQTDVITYSKEFEVRNGRCMQKRTWFVNGYSKRVDVTHWAELPKPPCL